MLYQELECKTGKLAKAFQKAFRGRVSVNRVGSIMSPFFTNQPVMDYAGAIASDRKEYAGYFHFLLEHGIYVAPSPFEAMFVSDAHLEQDIRRTCEVIESFSY
jgi:glutamate-1-semialdehyde 2,1-aminomutase